ncbi:MAG: isoprenylcysteine carboxylmethyltransferase family protein [Gemmatimonadetes bacterium]|nr:isoprenylcysteine carboxylmethyltransferase family protein [Gemmatimonadota bacterium]MYD25203.1 isoprenylcysteine carboxylmethyltransferase family protein [Gemmatimonadota bacterium]MYI98304.1 isoprenylcysteine carboxylmethyltransferase family protein [Gemmatimonadota bacterium]
MLAPLIAALVRHAIFAVALPWLILYRTAGMEEMRLDAGFPAAGSVLIVLGAALYIRAFAERIRMAAIVTAAAGTFEPTGDARPIPGGDARPIWSTGVHGWSRNPLQLGVLLILTGESLAFESLALLVYTALCWTGLTLYLVLVEEPALRRALGDEYLHYCRQVPRWFMRFGFRKPS